MSTKTVRGWSEGAATSTVKVSSKEFSLPLTTGEYRVRISDLPNGYKLEYVTAGALSLTEPFLITEQGIADRFTGRPTRTGIAIRLTAP